MNETYEKVIEIIQELIGKRDIEIKEDTRFFEDLGFDSILTMQLLVEAEESFGFDSEDSEESLQAFETVGKFVEFIEKNRRK